MKLDLPIDRKKFINGLIGSIAVTMRKVFPISKDGGGAYVESEGLLESRRIINSIIDKRLSNLGKGDSDAKIRK